MPEQHNYKSDITSRSKLYAIWDEGDDGTNEELAEICGCTVYTVATYRSDYHRASIVIEVDESDLPLRTNRGVLMWCVPDQTHKQCTADGCVYYDVCRECVMDGRFVVCERLLAREVE